MQVSHHLIWDKQHDNISMNEFCMQIESSAAVDQSSNTTNWLTLYEYISKHITCGHIICMTFPGNNIWTKSKFNGQKPHKAYNHSTVYFTSDRVYDNIIQ